MKKIISLCKLIQMLPHFLVKQKNDPKNKFQHSKIIQTNFSTAKLFKQILAKQNYSNNNFSEAKTSTKHFLSKEKTQKIHKTNTKEKQRKLKK